MALYLHENLGYSENHAQAVYHGFKMIVFFMCVAGGIISDIWLGKFKTILVLSIVYALGCVTLTLIAIPPIGIPQNIVFVALVLISVGSGGIKPCVSTFGGDQFKVPEQAEQLKKYFSMFFFAIIVAALISMTLTPILRSHVDCFGEHECYAVAFGVPAGLMIIAIRRFYS